MAVGPREPFSRRTISRNLAERRDEKLEEAAVRLAVALSRGPIGVSLDDRLPEGETRVTEALLTRSEIDYLPETRLIVNLIADAVKSHNAAVNQSPLGRSS